MTKKYLPQLVILLFSFMFIFGCKKGEDDPYLTFRSRDARIKGEWLLSDWEGSVVFEDSLYKETILYTMNNKIINISTSILETNLSGNVITTNIKESYSVIHTMQIKKDGIVENRYTGTNLLGGTDITYSNDGLWSWANAGKRKQSIIIEGFPLASSIESIYSIRELRNKQLGLNLDFVSSKIYPNYVQKIEGHFQFEFEKQ